MAYSQQQIDDFIALAQEVGSVPAMKELGYPKTRSTCHYWLKQHHIEIEVDDLKAKASEFDKWYQEREQALVLSTVLDRIMESMEEQHPPDQLVKLGRAAKDTVETLRLITGQSTHNLQVESVNSHLEAMLRKFKIDKDKTISDANRAALDAATNELSTSTPPTEIEGSEYSSQSTSNT